MGLYRREGSPYWWMWLEPPVGGSPKAESTKVRADGPTPAIRKANRQLADQVYFSRLAAYQRRALGFEPKPSITFEAYADWYETHVCVTHRSRQRERCTLNRFRGHFGRTPLAQITKSAVLEWRTTRLNEVQPATVDRELDTLKALFASAVPEYLAASPIAGLKRHRDTVQGQRRRPRILTHEEETRILRAATDPHERAIIILALDTLMRLSDVRTLRRDRDYGSVLHVESPKTVPYDVPVSTRVRKALDAIPHTGSAYYFPRRWSGPDASLSTNTVWRIFRRLCIQAQIPVGRKARGLTFHGLRHTGTTRLLEARVNPIAVRDIGGWSSLRQLDRYGHAEADTKRRAVELIGRRPRTS